MEPFPENPKSLKVCMDVYYSIERILIKGTYADILYYRLLFIQESGGKSY